MSKNIIEIALKAGFINTSNGLESPFIEGEDLTDNLKLFASLLLAQPEQEPVAWMYERQTGDFTERTLSVGFEKDFDGITIPLYLELPRRETLREHIDLNKAWHQIGYEKAKQEPKREPLSDEEILKLYQDFFRNTFVIGDMSPTIAFAKTIEKAHGIGVDDE
jgi:hypothetical protein